MRASIRRPSRRVRSCSSVSARHVFARVSCGRTVQPESLLRKARNPPVPWSQRRGRMTARQSLRGDSRMKLPQNAGRLTDRPGQVRGALPERGEDRGIRRREDPRAHPHRRDDHRTGDPGRRGDRRAGGRGGQPAAGDRGGVRGVQSRLLRLYAALEKSTLTFEALSPRILSRRQREDRLAAAREDAARQLTQRKVELPSGQEIKAYVADSRSFPEEGTFPERKALIRDFVKGVEVAGDEATLSYTIPTPAPMPAGGVTSERTPVPGCPEWWAPTASTGTGSGAAHPSSTSSASASAATCCA